MLLRHSQLTTAPSNLQFDCTYSTISTLTSDGRSFYCYNVKVKQNTQARALIFVSFVLVAVSWWQAEEIGIIFLPFIGIPVFTLSAYTTRFLEMKHKILGNLLALVAAVSTVYAFIVTWAGTHSQGSGFFGTTYDVPTTARVTSFAAVLFYIAGQIGLWHIYLAKSRRNSR